MISGMYDSSVDFSHGNYTELAILSISATTAYESARLRCRLAIAITSRLRARFEGTSKVNTPETSGSFYNE